MTRRRLRLAAIMFVAQLAIGTALALSVGFLWWLRGDGHRWTLQVTNQRDTQVLVTGISGGFNESTGYTIVQPHASTIATVSHDDAPPRDIIIDFESHTGPDGKLIVVPAWQATKRALVCPWDEVQRYQPLVVTDEVTTCPGLASP